MMPLRATRKKRFRLLQPLVPQTLVKVKVVLVEVWEWAVDMEWDKVWVAELEEDAAEGEVDIEVVETHEITDYNSFI
jgi:hypothetical protein